MSMVLVACKLVSQVVMVRGKVFVLVMVMLVLEGSWCSRFLPKSQRSLSRIRMRTVVVNGEIQMMMVDLMVDLVVVTLFVVAVV